MRSVRTDNWMQSWSFIFFLLVISCSVEKENVTDHSNEIRVPDFNADSAYFFVEKQVKFGPRVPNTPSHQAAGDYLVSQLKKYGANVIEQKFTATTFDNQKLNLRNIIASFHLEKSNRILLAAHWDTRPFADKDMQDKNAPMDGANDGASGVGVLLEIARVLSQDDSLAVGVDIILFDGEDWGERDGDQGNVSLRDGLYSWWCLGSQHWSKNKHKKNYSASFGILVDMVGERRAQFFREGASMEFAPGITNKVWSMANRIGYSDYFVKEDVESIIDDHLYVNQLAKIQMVDIVPYKAGLGFFGEYHHTQADNISIISKETLKVVGATVLHVIYYEQ